MDDFCLRIKKIPPPIRYNSDDIILRAILRAHFAKVIRNVLKDEDSE